MIERDDQFPPFDELLSELSEMRQVAQRVLGEVETTPCPV